MEKQNEERKKNFLDDGTEETSSTGNAAATGVVRRRTAKIIKRKEPTVDLRSLPPISLILQPSTIECYSTVESASVHTLDVLGSYYTAIVDEVSITGWRIDEHNKAKQELCLSSQHLQAGNRQALQSRESSCNRLYSSRLNSRLTKRREQYSFKHRDDIDDHLNHYTNHCSFSFLIISSRRKEPLLQGLPEQSDSTQEAMSEVMHRRRSGSTRNDHNRKSNRKLEENDELFDIQTNSPNHRLHSLASKLGVEDSIHKPTLVYLSKAKTGSANKRRLGEIDRVAESLMVTGASDSKETKLVDLADTNRRHLNSSRQSSRQPSSRQSSRQQEHNFSALSKPIKKERKDPSTISVSKYLNINNRSEKDKEKEENKDEKDKISELEEKKEKEDEEQYLQEADASCNHSTTEPWPDPYPIDLMADTGIKKDMVIRRTADSLGLHSHKWAKDFIERGFLNGRIPRNIYYHYSRPGTRCGSGSSDVSAIEKSKETKPKTERAVTTKGERNKADAITEKLQKLESVYYSGSTRRTLGAGGGMNSACKRKIIKGSVSRPQTQANVHKSRRQYCEGGGEERERKRSGIAKWAVMGEKWQNISPIKLST